MHTPLLVGLINALGIEMSAVLIIHMLLMAVR